MGSISNTFAAVGLLSLAPSRLPALCDMHTRQAARRSQRHCCQSRVESTQPSRKDILFLLMFLIGIGTYGFYRALDRYATAKNQGVVAQELDKDAAPV